MTDERRNIIIDPVMFKISNNKSQKKREPSLKIKVKEHLQKPAKTNKTSTLKKNLLRMIRGHQEKRMKTPAETKTSLHPDERPKSDFEQSIAFLSQIKKIIPIENKVKHNNNQTLRQRLPGETLQQTINQNIPINPYIPITNATPINCNIKRPNYGCLKNGILPTYRVWRNQTQKLNSSPQIPKSIIQMNQPTIRNSPVQTNYEAQLRDKIKEMSEREQFQNLKQKQRIWTKPKKQKRILRRTFRIGKSKAYPIISVLVSNKTLRNETNLRHTALKETPISEVKQYLKKQGFIKVGTNTPNDVLRQMYESASLICGEVKNYSPENLLYNYFNTDIGL